uniref:CCHC-type domain-containing protein n=1 Tax=Strongyloides stercoralis TaxID=6248 RepID=A0AAF5DIT2_STRER
MAEQLANLNNKPSLIAACQQSGLQTTGRKIDLARRLIESGIDLSNITYLILSLESISEEDLNLSYVPEDNRSPEANDNSEIPPHREEEYGNGMRSRTLDLTMFKQLPEFKKGSDPEIFKDNFMRCMILSGLQIGDPRAAMWLLLRVEDTIQRRLKDTFPNIDNESAATLLGTLVRWYGKKMKAEEAENQLLTFEIRMEQIKTNEEFKKKLQWLRELIEAKYYDLSMERKNEMYKFEIIKLFRGIGHLKGLSEYGMSYKIPMLETEALRINEDFQRNRLRRMATTTTTFQGSCYNCGKMGHRGYQCKENTTKTDIKGKNSIKTMLVKESEAEEVQQLLDLIRMNDENSDSTEDYDKMLNIYETTNVESLKKTEDDDILEIKIKRKNDEQGEIHKMLADTRSNRNILSESALIKLIKNKKNKINKSDIKIKKTFLKGLGDATITSHAYITVDLEFKGHTTSTDILILKDKDILTTGDYDGIISKKTLKELGMKLTEQGIHQNYGKILSWISTKYHKEKVDVKKLAIILKHLKLMIQNCKVCNETNTLTRIKRKTKEIPQPGNDFEDELAIISTYMNCMPRSSTNITPAEVMLHSKMKPYGNNQLEIIKKIGDEWELDELVNNDHIETLRLLKKLKNNRQKEIGMEELPTSNYVWQRKLNRNKRKLEGPNQIRKLKKDKDGLVCIDIKGADDGRTKRKFNALKYRNVLQKT